MLPEIYGLSDTDILRKIGRYLRRERLNRNITQEELQNITGVHKKTISDAENGKNVTLINVISIMRGLELLSRIDFMMENEQISPVMLAKLKGKVPERASGRRGEKE
jgi:transcriptional regulator with XRE-family HTH domain